MTAMTPFFSDSDSVSAAAARAFERCDILAGFTEEPGRITRTFLSPPMHDVHRIVREWMEAVGLTVRVDAVGNIFGEAGAADLSVLLLGSHLDTIRNAGRYDGILGVLLAIEAAGIVLASDQALPFALHVVGFSEEEGVRFMPYIGSLAAAGAFDLAFLEQRDEAGKTMREAISEFGFDPAEVPAAAYPPGRLMGYTELHIEQGPRLEDSNRPVAAVDAIAGQSRMLMRVTGQAGHAGNCPMPLRRDALAGAAELILALETIALETPGLVATVGYIETRPNVSNVIAGEVTLSADIRHKDDGVRMAAVAELKREADRMAYARDLTFTIDRERGFAAVPMDTRLAAIMEASVEAVTGIVPPEEETALLTSGAGHDAAMIAAIAPVAMLFVRGLNGGLSHHPDEAVLPEDVETALRVLVHFIQKLAQI